jgi:RimJ/RimL family protein N-acetyltransferase
MRLVEKDVTLRLVEESDAEFIFNLRQNEELNKYLNKVSSKIEDQTSFIKKSRELCGKGLEYYFIIEYKNEPVGTIRIYNINHELKTCTWGSFIIDKTTIKDEKPPKISVISLYAIFDFIFNKLGFPKIDFDVRKDNKNIKNFYIKFGGEVLKEDEIDCYLQITKHNYENIFLKIYSTELQAYINNDLIL